MVPGKAVVLTARRGFAAFLGAGIVLALSGCATAPVAAPATAISPALLDGPQPPPATAVAPSARRQAAEDKALDRIFIDDTQMQQALDPLGTLERGQVPDLAQLRLVYTPALVAQERAANDHIRHRLDTIDRAALDDAHRISFDAFVQVNRGEQAMLAPDAQAMLAALPFNHFSGLPSEFPQLAAAESVPLNTADDFAQRLAVLETLPVLFGNATDRFREGIRSGVVQPRMTVANMIAQIDAILAQPVDRSPFMAPASRIPATFTPGDRRRISAAFHKAVSQQVYPAYASLRRFMADEYLPVTRPAPGLGAMPGGETLYRLLLRQHTTLDLDPETLHQLGLSEVARIRGEMEKVRQQIGFAGTLPAFFDEVRRNPRYHPATAQQLQKSYVAVGARVASLVPRFFMHLPRTRLVIEPYPVLGDKFEAGGGYAPGAPDGSKPGVFFFNSFDLKSRNLTGVTALYLHEAEPGHHFQISLAQEDESLPAFQRFGGNTAFVEGWAHYAESLGYDMGLYQDPLQHWGALDEEMLRAMRLVVDTGLHAQGWTREQAMAYMLANSGIGRGDAAAEVDRYIANPGQAVAYKIGALTIQRLRHTAETVLGPRFDIRAFHDQVLGSGALPLPVLEAKIDRWIASVKKG